MELAERIARLSGAELGRLEERDFEDGEHKVRPLTSVRDRDVHVLHSLHHDAAGSVHDKLCRLLFLIATLKDAGAARVTVLAPYLCYMRKDRRSHAADPLSTRYVAQLFEAVGSDCIVTLDVHNLAAFENAFRCRTEHLSATGLFAAHFAARSDLSRIAVVSPDEGGIKRCEALRAELSELTGAPVGSGFMEKRRSGSVLSGERIVGDFDGHDVIVFDDVIGTGATLLRTARACRAHGARKVIGAATHGLFSRAEHTVLEDPAFDDLVITNSVLPPHVDPSRPDSRLVTLDVAPLLAACVQRAAPQRLDASSR